MLSSKHNNSVQIPLNENKARDKYLWSSNYVVQDDPGSPNFGVKMIKASKSSNKNQEMLS